MYNKYEMSFRRFSVWMLLSLLTVLVVSTISGCSSKEKTEILDEKEAGKVIAKYLKNLHHDVEVKADIFEKGIAKVDVIGMYDRWIVAVDYDTSSSAGKIPLISPDIDYYLSLKASDRFTLSKALDKLKTISFTPVVSHVQIAKKLPLGERLNVLLSVRNASGGDCDITDTNGTVKSFALVKGTDAGTFILPQHAGMHLPVGDYKIECSFANQIAEYPDSDLVRLADFSVTASGSSLTKLKYIKGLKSRSCIPGQRLKFEAFFSVPDLKIVYYSEDERIFSDTFVCDFPGKYTIHAVATTDTGEQAVSPDITIQVDELPEIFRELQDAEHVTF